MIKLAWQRRIYSGRFIFYSFFLADIHSYRSNSWDAERKNFLVLRLAGSHLINVSSLISYMLSSKEHFWNLLCSVLKKSK